MADGLPRPTRRLLDLLGGAVLAERIDRPERRRDPADQRELQNQADDAGNRPADGEEQQEGQKDRDDQAHHGSPGVVSLKKLSITYAIVNLF